MLAMTSGVWPTPDGAFQHPDFAADRKSRHGKMNGKGPAARVVRRTLAVSSRGERMRARRLLDCEATHLTRRHPRGSARLDDERVWELRRHHPTLWLLMMRVYAIDSTSHSCVSLSVFGVGSVVGVVISDRPSAHGRASA